MAEQHISAFSNVILLNEFRRRMSSGDIDDIELRRILEKRGYYVFEDDPTDADDDVDLDEVETSEIVEHLSGLGYEVIESGKLPDHLSELPPYKLKDLFCDMVGVNHHTPKDELMKLIAAKI